MFSLRSVLSSVSGYLNVTNSGSDANGVQKTSILDRFKMNFSFGSSQTQSANHQALSFLANTIDQDGSKSDNIRTQTLTIRVDDGKTQLSYEKLNREVVKGTLAMHGIRPSNVELEDLMARPGMNANDLNGKDNPGLMKQARVVTDGSGRQAFGYQYSVSPKFQRAILADYAQVKGELAATPDKKAVIDMSQSERIAETVKIAYEKGYISKEVKEQLGNISSTELGIAFGTGGAVGIIASEAGGAAVMGPVGTVAGSLYAIKQTADFEGIVKGADRATSRAELDKPAQEFGAWMGRLSKDGVLAIVGAAGAKIAPRVAPAGVAKTEQAVTNTAKGVKEVLSEQSPALGQQPKLAPANNAPLDKLNVQTPKTSKSPLEKIQDPIEARAAKAENTGPRRDIEMQEAAGGHTIERHVGKSESWLRKRIETDPTLRVDGTASSFRNETVANRTQGQFIKQNKQAIIDWLKGESNRPFTDVVEMKEPVGIIVERGKPGFVETAKARVVLVKDNSEHGWHILTSFPTK